MGCRTGLEVEILCHLWLFSFLTTLMPTTKVLWPKQFSKPLYQTLLPIVPTLGTLAIRPRHNNGHDAVCHDRFMRPLRQDEILMMMPETPLHYRTCGYGCTADIVEYNDAPSDTDKLRNLKALDYHDDDKVEPSIGDKAWDEIYELLDWTIRLLKSPNGSCHSQPIAAIFKQKAYEDYNAAPEPDPDSGSRHLDW